jgi:hypothetical protein
LDDKFEEFTKAVRDSVEQHALRKNYTVNDANGSNQLADICKRLEIHEEHGVGEIIYKAAEFLKAPKETKKLLCTKIAGWAFVLYRNTDE